MTTIATVGELWTSLSSELAIFVATLAFAFAISGVSGRPAVKKGIKGQQSQKALRRQDDSPRGTSPPAAAPEPRAARAVARRAVEGERGEPGRPGLAPAVRPGRRCWKAAQIMDTIVEGVREHPAARFATSALERYAEFKTMLEEDRIGMAEVERNSQHSGMDFFSALVLCITRAGKYFLIEGLVDDMVRFGVNRSLNFYESAMKQFAGQKQYHFALFLYDRLVRDGLQPSIVTCSCLINFAAEVGEFHKAIDFFKKLASRTTPSIRAYMTVLRVYGKLQDWPSSMETFRDMQRRRVAIDSFVINVILATGVAADEMVAVEALVAEVSPTAPPVLDIVSYNILVKGYAQQNNFERVVEVANRMRKRGLTPNAITFNSMMDAAVRSQQSGEVWSLLSEMRNSGLRPDKYTCSILVKSLNLSPVPTRIEGTLEVLMEVSDVCDSTLRSTLYHAVFEAAAQAGDAALLARVFSQMRQYKVVPTVAMVRHLNECTQASDSDASPITDRAADTGVAR